MSVGLLRKYLKMKILFWNTKKNCNINQYIYSLVCENDIDILVVAEYEADKNELQSLLEKCPQNLVDCNTYGCNRIKLWANYVNIKPGIQEKYYSIQVIRDKYILCCVHLISDSHGDRSEERLAIIQEIMYEINEIENKIKSYKIVIIGDFNEMPYGRGCLSANGFHGLPVLNTSDTPTRKVNQIEYRKFYNPMWNFMGDFSYPPGTYYLNQAKLYSPMWYRLDQVIVSKDVLPLLKKESVKIITSCGYSDLVDKNQHPDKKISDHFPIMCEIVDE